MTDISRPDGIEPELLDRYLSGECSEQEAATVRRYLMAHPRASAALESFLRRLDGEVARPAAPDATASWQSMRARLHGPEGVAPERAAEATDLSARRRVTVPTPRHLFAQLPPYHVSRWRRIAAAVLVVATGLGAAALYRTPHPATRPAPSTEGETFVTANRERAELRLSDGTRIHLAPASRLRVASDYGMRTRDLWLEGEGYFEVEHDARRPFSVHAGATVARDLGTAFAVRSYTDDAGVQVVVRSGAVDLRGVGSLRAGDVGRFGANGSASVTHHANVDTLLGWLDGRLTFRDAPLSVVLGELRRWHDTDVRLADPSLGTLPFTGVLTDASFRSSIDLVAATLGLHVRRGQEGLVLERNAARSGPPSRPAAARRTPTEGH